MDVSHQVVRLSPGKHSSPEKGVCVMELASMLAGEPFSDHPRAVSPVIGALLRAYNDAVDDDRRQDLYRYAAEVVGSVAPREVEGRRAGRCIAWATEIDPALTFRLRRWVKRWRLGNAGQLAGRAAARRIDDYGHRQALAFVDELLAIGAPTIEETLACESVITRPLAHPDRS
jgi:hypothetical protein